jgi:hypothetical protein
MSRHLLALALLLATLGLASCYVHHHGPPPPHRPRCFTGCAEWGFREACERRCRVWAGGVCMAFDQRCRPQRVCFRHETRCH